MTQARKNWYLVLSLLVIAALMFITTMGIIRAGGPVRILCIILDVAWLYLAYEAVLRFAGKPKEEEQEEKSNQA